MRYNTQGIILGKKNFREATSFFSIYTLEKGKVEAIARGVKKPKSKLGGHLDYFSVIDLMIADGKNFNHIGGALREKNFFQIKKDFRKINLGFYSLEITDYFIQIEKSDKKIFDLLKNYLTILDQDKRCVDYLFSLFLTYLYILKLLVYLGYKPEIEYCTECKNKIENKIENYFKPISGGVICPDCFQANKKFTKSIKISQGILKNIKEIIIQELGKIDIERQKIKEIIKIIDIFLIYRLDREIKSRRFLIKIKN